MKPQGFGILDWTSNKTKEKQRIASLSRKTRRDAASTFKNAGALDETSPSPMGY
jgi:hypothetical protein